MLTFDNGAGEAGEAGEAGDVFSHTLFIHYSLYRSEFLELMCIFSIDVGMFHLMHVQSNVWDSCKRRSQIQSL